VTNIGGKIASATTRRQATFLGSEEWATTPWVLHPELKTSNSKLLDIMARVPQILQAVDDAVGHRERWIVGYEDSALQEAPISQPDLYRHVQNIILDIQIWQTQWLTLHGSAALGILKWAGILDVEVTRRNALDPCVLNMAAAFKGQPESWAEHGLGAPPVTAKTYDLMYEAVMFMTVSKWGSGLLEKLDPTSHSTGCVIFGIRPDGEECPCSSRDHWSLQTPQFYPDSAQVMDPRASWNIYTSKIAQSPIRLSAPSPSSQTGSLSSGGSRVGHTSSLSPTPGANGVECKLLLPNDARFASQLHILNWLVSCLPESRAQVLGTLAAMGLGHCVNDTRPTEGIESIAEAVRGAMERSRFEGAAAVIMKNYR
jgi:hypothetical protein